MTKLVWDRSVAQNYQLGIDRGVLYVHGSPGVPWNGLISVAEDSVGGDRTAFYHDGDKFAEGVNTSVFAATIKAINAPFEFEECVGNKEIVPGFSLTGQSRKSFDLCYRTKIGTIGYKLHLIYNASAMSPDKDNKTRGSSSAPLELSWKIDAVPPATFGDWAPTAHFIIDSTEMDPTRLALLETYLYGNNVNAAAMPPLKTLISTVSPSKVGSLYERN
jgi:hypothetical protein